LCLNHRNDPFLPVRPWLPVETPWS
jgi:hypothetical protein